MRQLLLICATLASLTGLAYADDGPTLWAASPDGKWLVTLTDWGPADIWQASELKLSRKVPTFSIPEITSEFHANQGLCFSPDGQRALAWSNGGDALVFRPDDGSVLCRFHLPIVWSDADCRAGADFSPDGRQIAFCVHQDSVQFHSGMGSQQSLYFVVDAATGAVLHKHGESPGPKTMHPPLRWVGGQIIARRTAPTAVLANAPPHWASFKVTPHGLQEEGPEGHSWAAWNIATAGFLHDIGAPRTSEPPIGLALSPDHTLIAQLDDSAAHGLSLLRASDGRTIVHLTVPGRAWAQGTPAFRSDGRLLVISGQTTLYTFNVSSGRCVGTAKVPAHVDTASLVWVPGSNRVVAPTHAAWITWSVSPEGAIHLEP